MKLVGVDDINAFFTYVHGNSYLIIKTIRLHLLWNGALTLKYVEITLTVVIGKGLACLPV